MAYGHRLGMALQICTVRYTGRFLGEDPLAVPWVVVGVLGGVRVTQWQQTLAGGFGSV